MQESAIPSATLKVRLLQRLSIRRDAQDLESRLSSKARELFCYLLLYRHQTHHREALATLLWPESDPAKSRQYLRKSLWQLLAALNREADVSAQRVLVLEAGWISVNPQADLWIDAAALEQAFDIVRGIPAADLEAPTAGLVQQAVDLYLGHLLEGWYMEWCLLERERLQGMYLLLLDKLIGHCEARGDYETGLTYGARALRCDRASERTHRKLMRLRYLAGDRTGALRQFERCVAALQEELGVGPEERTLALYREIQGNQLAVPSGDKSRRTSPSDERGREPLPASWPLPAEAASTGPAVVPPT